VDLSINEGTLVVTGGPGDSVQTAIVIKKTPRGLSAGGAELLLLTQRFGRRGQQWSIENQDLLTINGRVFDMFQIVLEGDGSRRCVYFDISDWLARVQQQGER
jgi:hypothetical protein